MFENLSMLRVSGLMARHASAAQKAISENIASADSPNYTPKVVTNFSNFIFQEGEKISPYHTRNEHFEWNFDVSSHQDGKSFSTERKPNGNTVSIEVETMKSVEVERQHSQALAIYQHSIDLLKTSLGRGR